MNSGLVLSSNIVYSPYLSNEVVDIVLSVEKTRTDEAELSSCSFATCYVSVSGVWHSTGTVVLAICVVYVVLLIWCVWKVRAASSQIRSRKMMSYV